MSISTKELKDNFSQIIKKVSKSKEAVIIYEKTEPEAVLIDYATYNIFLSLFEELELKGRFIEAYKSTRDEPTISHAKLKQKYGLL